MSWTTRRMRHLWVDFISEIGCKNTNNFSIQPTFIKIFLSIRFKDLYYNNIYLHIYSFHSFSNTQKKTIYKGERRKIEVNLSPSAQRKNGARNNQVMNKNYAILWKTLTTSSSFSKRSMRPLTSSCCSGVSSRMVRGIRSNLNDLIS